MDFIQRETQKIKSGQFEQRRRRWDWSLMVRDRILNTCGEFVEKGNSNGYPYRLFCHRGSQDQNAETIQFGIGINPTGIVQHRSIDSEDTNTTTRAKMVTEKGCALVFSQGPTGYISIILYPYKSELHCRIEENIILYHSLEPARLTKRIINKALHKSLFYARVSSLAGLSKGFSFFDRCKFFVIKFLDIRSRSERVLGVMNLSNEWWKIIIASMIMAVVTLITTVLYNLFW